MTAPSITIRTVPDGIGLEAFGARSIDDFLVPESGMLTTGQRRRELPRASAARRYLLPLPGTPSDDWPMPERPAGPGGLGTGWLRVHVYRAEATPRKEAWRARTRPPRSSSLAARDWNLACQLRAHGAGAPEPLALLERPRGWLRGDSVFIARELEGFVPAAKWFAEAAGGRAGAEFQLGVQAVAAAFSALERARVWLNELALEDVWIATRSAPSCAAEEIFELQQLGQLAREQALARRRLPSVAFVRFDGGRMVDRFARRAAQAQFQHFLDALDAQARLAVADEVERPIPRNHG
jgi:hypothetical protein